MKLKLNPKGFSLIEILAVVIIMGVLLLVVIPNISRIIVRNENKKFDFYYESVKKATLAYSDYLVDKIGGVNDIGCLENGRINNDLKLSIELLEERGLLSPFDESGIICDITDAYIRNDKGKISYSVGLSCSNEKEGIIYKKNYEAPSSCEVYKYQGEDNIMTKLLNDSNTNTIGNIGNQVFISNDNNYVWYSGMLWRVYSYNSKTETVKMINADSITISNFSSLDHTLYEDSYVYEWLQYNYLPKLKDPVHYLLNTKWYVDDHETSTFARIGLMSLQEYEFIQSLGINTNFWLSTRNDDNTVNYVNSNGKVESTVSTAYMGIRPVIAMYSDIYVTSGNGSYNNPYRLAGDNDIGSEIKGNLLNTRYIGEYVTFSNSLYRIIDISNGYVKIAKDIPLDEDIAYDSNSYNEYTYSSLGSYLINEWYPKLSQKNLVSYGDFCIENFTGLLSSTCSDLNHVTAIKVGLIRPGDVYFGNWKSDFLFEWTMLKNNNEHEILIITDQYSYDYSVTNTNGFARPVMYLNNNVKIRYGTGVITDPFIVE